MTRTVRNFVILLLVTALTGASLQSWASDDLGFRIFTKAGTFEEASDDLKDAITNRGFVIDYVGQFNAMLERTADVASSVTATGSPSPYKNAQYMQFCPSKLTHEAVSASPLAITNCPISIFVYELVREPGKVHVGFRLPVGSPSRLSKMVNAKLTALLTEIVKDVTK